MLTHLSKADVLGQLKTESPVNQGRIPRRGMRYPKEFKELVLQAMDKEVTVSEIAAATGVGSQCIHGWRKARLACKPKVRKLRVVAEHKKEKPGKAMAVINVGTKVTIEIEVKDLNTDLFMQLARL